MTRSITRLIAILGGLYFLLEFVIPARMPSWLGGFENPLSPSLPDVASVVQVLSAMVFLLGPIHLARHHISAIIHKRENWVGSIVFLVSLLVTIVAMGGRGLTGDAAPKAAANFQLAFDVMYWGVVFGFGASSMALLAFYLVSAAYRAFRLTNLDAAVMMAAAVVVLLGMAPVGDWITLWLPEAGQFRFWARKILEVPNTAVQRAVLIGGAAGGFAAGMRLWLGIGKRGD